jgi:hypothetical protein
MMSSTGPTSRPVRLASPTTHHSLVKMHDYLHHTLYLTLCGVGVVVHRQTKPAPEIPKAGGAIDHAGYTKSRASGAVAGD